MITPLVELFLGGITLTPKRGYMKFSIQLLWSYLFNRFHHDNNTKRD